MLGFYYDLVKASVERITLGLTAELANTSCTAVAVIPGWLRSERMLENFGVTEENWRDALEKQPHFCSSESPTYVRAGSRRSPRIRTSHVTRAVFSRVPSWRERTASPRSTGCNPTAGTTSSRFTCRVSPPTTSATDNART